MTVTVRVPATIANLGPGFDSLALAVGLANEIRVEAGGAFRIEIEGEGAGAGAGDLPRDESNLVLKAMQAAAAGAGRDLPPVQIKCRNDIPLERGLGSSAAAVVGGLLAGSAIVGAERGAEHLLKLAVEFEGHADNVAAALYGGAVVAYRKADGAWRAESIDVSPSLRPVVLIPEHQRVSTTAARAGLAKEVALGDASFNVSRAALVVHALAAGRVDLLSVALEDRLHQDARLGLVPSARQLFDRLRAAGIPVCVAGSGPSLLAFETGAVFPELPSGWRAVRVGVDPRGAEAAAE